MNLLAVDPGLRACGVACFGRGVLLRAELVLPHVDSLAQPPESGPQTWRAMVSGVAGCWRGDVVVVEFPKVYQGGKQKGDPADLLELAAVVGAISELASRMGIGRVRRVFPHEWKGQMSKTTANRRVLERLSENEKSRIVDAGAKTHNVLDAIGIGLFHLGRFERKRVFAK